MRNTDLTRGYIQFFAMAIEPDPKWVRVYYTCYLSKEVLFFQGIDCQSRPCVCPIMVLSKREEGSYF